MAISYAAALKMKTRAENTIVKLDIQRAEAKALLHEATILMAQAARSKPSPVAVTNPRFATSLYVCTRPNPQILATFWRQAQQIVEMLTPEDQPEVILTGAQIIERLEKMPTNQSTLAAFTQMKSRFLTPYILRVPMDSAFQITVSETVKTANTVKPVKPAKPAKQTVKPAKQTVKQAKPENQKQKTAAVPKVMTMGG